MQQYVRPAKRCICIRGNKPLLQEGIRSVLLKSLPDICLIEADAPVQQPVCLILCVTEPGQIAPFLEASKKYYVVAQTVILSDHFSGADILRYIALGCQCLLKCTISEHELLNCILLGEKGVFLWDSGLTETLVQQVKRLERIVQQLPPNPEQMKPTGRELEIAKGILSGLDNTDIARTLYLSRGTVKNAVSAILEKYGFRTRAQIITLLFW